MSNPLRPPDGTADVGANKSSPSPTCQTVPSIKQTGALCGLTLTQLCSSRISYLLIRSTPDGAALPDPPSADHVPEPWLMAGRIRPIRLNSTEAAQTPSDDFITTEATQAFQGAGLCIHGHRPGWRKQQAETHQHCSMDYFI
jgi:hypothetical protein